MWVQSLGREDSLDKEIEFPGKEIQPTCILAWKLPWIEEPGRLWSMGSQRVRDDLVTEST